MSTEKRTVQRYDRAGGVAGSGRAEAWITVRLADGTTVLDVTVTDDNPDEALRRIVTLARVAHADGPGRVTDQRAGMEPDQPVTSASIRVVSDQIAEAMGRARVMVTPPPETDGNGSAGSDAEAGTPPQENCPVARTHGAHVWRKAGEPDGTGVARWSTEPELVQCPGVEAGPSAAFGGVRPSPPPVQG